nr:hypothetical protein [Tanacetum cinerariifolium]
MIIPCPTGIVQAAKLYKMYYTRDGGEESVMSTQVYIRKVYEDMGEDDDFTRGSWLSVVEYVNVDGGIMSGCFGDIKKFLNNGKLKKVITIITSCTPNALGDLTVTLKDLSVIKMSVPATNDEKINMKNDVKARRLLLMAPPNEHQLTFSQYNDAKIIFAAIKTQFGGVIITQEDLNSKFLRSLPPEWNTHVVVWMNKADIETVSIDDLYNKFKIVEQDVRKSVGTSTGAQNMAFMTAPSTSSTNDVNIANHAYEASTVSPNVNTASLQVSTANFSDNAVYAFMVETPNGSNLLQQDLEHIHKDDREAMDLRWQLSLLSMRAKECFNCHKMGHFTRECIAQKNQDSRFRSHDNTRKQGNNEDTSSKAMLAIDATYKRGLANVEEQLVTYKNNEVLFIKEVAVLKREVACKDYEINVLKSEFEKVKQEKEGIEFKIKKFDNASKSLDKLIGSQITDNSKKGLRYHAVPPPHPLIYNGPTKLNLSYSGLDEFKEPEFKGYGPRDSKLESNINHDQKSDDSKENSDESFVKQQISEDTSSLVESPLNGKSCNTLILTNIAAKANLSNRSCEKLEAGSESRPPMLNKENYVPWSSRLLRYAKSRPNGKLIHNSILNGPYVRKIIPEPDDANCDMTITETFHLQTDDELSDKELKQIEADDQAIQTIFLGLPEDIYAAVDSCETAQEI